MSKVIEEINALISLRKKMGRTDIADIEYLKSLYLADKKLDSGGRIDSELPKNIAKEDKPKLNRVSIMNKFTGAIRELEVEPMKCYEIERHEIPLPKKEQSKYSECKAMRILKDLSEKGFGISTSLEELKRSIQKVEREQE
jgi:hypothetical protein